MTIFAEITITELMSVFIAFCALGLTIWNAHQTKTHNQLSVKPYLTIHRDQSFNKGNKIIYIKNAGSGPAILKKMIATYKDIQYEEPSIDEFQNVLRADSLSYLTNLFKGVHCTVITNTNIILGESALSAGDCFNFLELSNDTKVQCNTDLRDIKIIIEYEDIYGNSFLLKD